MQSVSSRSETTSIVYAEIVTAVLLLVEGYILIYAASNGLIGAGLLNLLGEVGIVWAILSFVAAYGLRTAKRWSWILTMILSIVFIALNAAVIGLAATFTGGITYPGLAIVVLLVVNDVMLAEVAVSYLLLKRDVRALFAKAA